MNLEWNAQMFITDNCVNCSFHAEVFAPNFGREVLAQQQQAAQAAALQTREQGARRAELQAEIDSLLEHEQTQVDTKALSILTLVQQLGSEQADQAVAAATILEAARLSPRFFTTAAINYLALHLDSPQASQLLQALRLLVESGYELPDFARQRLLAVVEEGEHLDAAIGVIVATVAPLELLVAPDSLRRILERMRYERRAMYMRAEEAGIIYPNVVILLQRLAATDLVAYESLLRQQLALPDKEDRIRVLGLLQDVTAVAPELVLPLADGVIRSLAFVEDGYGESADHAVRQLLASLYAYASEAIFTTLDEMYPGLVVEAQLELLEFYGRALQDKNLLLPQHAAAWVSQLVSGMAATDSDVLKDTALEQVEDVAYHAPQLLAHHQDAILGFLVSVVNDYRRFQWFRAELQNPVAPPTTFNPLLGRHSLEVQNLDMQEQRRVHRAERIVEHMLRGLRGDMHQAVMTVFEKVTSETDGLLKARLLTVLRNGLNDSIRLGQTLPIIYTSLFDTGAVDVRREALRSVEHLLDNHPQCVTVTLLSVVKALLKDPDVPIRGQAIRAYGALMRQFAEQVEPEHLQLVLEAITNKYVALHKAAAATALSVAPLLKPEQRLLLLVGVLQLEQAYYAERDYEYCKELMGIALRLTQDNPAQRLHIVKAHLIKYCTCGEIYTEKDFVKRLTHLAADEPQLRSTWLAQALAYMQRVEPDYSSHVDLRDVLLPAVQQLPHEEIVAHLEVLVSFTQAQIRAAHYQDVYGIYAVFGAQGLHSPLHDLTQYFVQEVPATKANASALEVNASFHHLSGLEVAVGAARVDKSLLTTLRS